MNGCSKGNLFYFALLDLPEVEDTAGAGHVDAEGDEVPLGGQEEHLPHGQVLVLEVASQLHS